MSGRVPSAAGASSGRAACLAACLVAFLVVVAAPAMGADRSAPKRILLLHSFGRDFRPWSEYALSIKAVLEQQAQWPLDVQEHTLLTARFNNPGPEEPFVNYLRSLYAGVPPDVVVSIGAPAARFAQKYRDQLFPDTPMVLTVVEERLVNRADLTDNDTVVSVQNNFTAAFYGILKVLPETKTIAVVIGASRLEKFWLDEIKRETAPFEGRLAFVWYNELSFDEILKRASVLPPHTVLFWGLMSVDGAGIVHESDLALRSLRAVANAPIFSYQEPFFNGYTVGGPMHSIGDTSKKTVEAVIRILAGERPSTMRFEPLQFGPPKYDWREMQRWGINESDLPVGSEVLFRQAGLWETYRWQIAMLAAVILIQAGLIGGLLYERRRRLVAEVESRQRLAELAHVNRYAAAGELTTSIAHELNQPLGSILTNTETAELMLKSESPNLVEIGEILADIRRDDQRASEVIRRLRSILKKTPFEIANIDLNDTVGEAIRLLSAVSDGRRIALKFAPSTSVLRVKGDPIQLQQVILNLIINAIDAISQAGATEREINVATAQSDAFAEIRISDSGPGIAPADVKDIFNPFFSTKPQGMGMGLAIVRTIVEAHGGKIAAENQPSRGALFTILLPIAH
ncbi:sensor histidine kinase [Bradyrhizobium diversitatis]|uniref:histidine kinase n=1 Tax=Bradyrhizobium diversitatis TaxID=2755406 RepID=A0ABS0PAR7_9BRAD|nr:ATP-binding protein [Bradyrhizobium diversitatis]MBH5390263.1 GHKL domain-containing protein [Bradyrhizobium diversitatis]